MIRSATAHDLAAIMQLERETFPVDAWSEQSMRDELASPHTWYIVDEDVHQDGGIAVRGYAGLRAPTGSREADIQTIAVAAAARGGGRGRALLQALLDEAQRRGAAEVFLDVRDDNPVALALYQSVGFAEIGRRAGYYPAGAGPAVDGLRVDRLRADSGPRVDGIVMRRAGVSR